MSEEKTMPEWGEIVHVDGDPFVVIRIKAINLIEVAHKHGGLYTFSTENFDEYKPRTITINGVKVPEPVRKPLEYWQLFWVVHLAGEGPESHLWKNDSLDYQWLERGMIHLTEENAKAHTDAIYRANRGETG